MEKEFEKRIDTYIYIYIYMRNILLYMWNNITLLQLCSNIKLKLKKKKKTKWRDTMIAKERSYQVYTSFLCF